MAQHPATCSSSGRVILPLRRKHQRVKKRALLFPAMIPLIIVSGLLINWVFLAQMVFASPLAPTAKSGQNTLQQFLRQGQPMKLNQGGFHRPAGTILSGKDGKQNKPLPSAEPAKMHDLTYILDDSFVLHRPAMKQSSQPEKVTGTVIPAGTTPLVAKGNDGRLEIDLPRGSLDFAQATLADGGVPVGRLFLRIHQISGHFIGSESVLGTYQIQILDSQGHVVQGVVLKTPATIVYHYQTWELQDLDIDPAQVHLAWPALLAQAMVVKQSTSGLVTPMSNNASAQTLTAQSSILNGVMTASSTPEIQTPGKPDLFETSGNSGQYSYSYPLTVAPGPDGFAPQLTLNYSSQSTNGRNSRRAPAGDEGDGWSLSLGSITASTYPSSSTGGAATWYSINGVDGVSDKLVPSPAGQTTYYETQHMSHLHIEWTGDHWRVMGLDGTYYSLGGTPDSQQKTAAGVYEWDVNKILAPFNKTNVIKAMFITYLQDSPDGGTTIRDAGLKQIQYGYTNGNLSSSLTTVMGTVDFHYHAPSSNGSWATAYGTNYHCSSTPPASTTLRCDDPITYNSVTAPDVMSTLTLDSVTSYIGSDSTGELAYRYDLTYQNQPFTENYWDPYTQIQQAAAGEHLLTQITPTLYVSGTAHARKGVAFGYTDQLRDSYRDPSQFALGSTTTHFSGQTFWSYLTSYEDLNTGEGARISYATARANMDGTPYTTDSQGNVTDDRFDPLYCANNANNSDPSKQCTGVYGHPDDYSWSLQVVTQISALGTDSSGNTTVATTKYLYGLLGITNTSRTPVSSCNPITGTGVPVQESSCTLDNWVPGYNGTDTPQHDGDWADYYHAEFRGFATISTISPATNWTIDHYHAGDGWWTATSNGSNYNSGSLYQEDVYQGSNTTSSGLLKETLTYYAGVGNTPAGNSYSGFNTCNGNLSAIYTPCVHAPLETKTIFYGGKVSATNAPWIDVKYTYDDLNGTQGFTGSGYHNLVQRVTTGSNLPSSIYPMTEKWTYTPDKGNNTNGIFYYDVNKVTHSEIDDNSGHVWQCQDTTYDEGSGLTAPAAGWPTTQTSYSTCGNASTALKSYTGYDQYGNVVATVDPLGAANQNWYSSGGCSLTTAPVYLPPSWTEGHYTSCSTYDSTTADLPTIQANALGQTTNLSYDYTSGATPISAIDPNGQATSSSLAYDSSGNETINTSQPGESGSYTTRQSENSQCTAASTLPCYEIDTNTSLYSSAVSRTFYDAQGRAVETRTPGPTPGDDTVVMTVYNDQNDTSWKSVPFQVTSGSGWIDPAVAKDINGNAPAGTTTFLDALGRTIATQDPNFGSAQEPGLACSWTLSGKYTSCINYDFTDPFDATWYSLARHIDANGHEAFTWTNVVGNTVGTGTYAGVYPDDSTALQITEIQYNALNKPTSVMVVDEHSPSGGKPTVTTTMTYDDLGRMLTMNDPDRGTFSYSYDPDGHVLSVTQTSGSNSRTLGYNYDLLGRVGCEQTASPTPNATGACSAGNPLLQNTYDTTVLGTQGSTDFPIGHLTQSVATTYYPDGTSATVTQKTQTDQRGRTFNTNMQFGLPSGWNVTAGLPGYQLSTSYNDAGQVTATTATAGTATYSFSPVYDATTGSLQGLSSGTSGSTANLASLAYNEFAQLSGITLLNGSSTQVASVQYSYDGDQRPSSLTANWLPGSGNSGQLLSQGRSYDNASNVISSNTVFAAVPGQGSSGGIEVQNFCYDEQNRLVWAGNGGTQPGAGNGTCGSGTLSNSLNGAGYTNTYQYTNLGQIWQGAVSNDSQQLQYLYCGSGPHQLTGVFPAGTTCSTTSGVTATYRASYDPWGNMISRGYNSITATLTYDALNRLTSYSASNGQEQYVYDASGQRVLKRSTSAGSTTLTAYAFGLQELTYTGTGTLASQIDYYSVAGHLIGEYNGSTTVYNLTDALGTVLLSLSLSAVIGEQSFGPYGTQHYGVGTIGTPKGYTGQIRDSLTGLDYYNARYYDPEVGQFLSVDTVQGNPQGMDPYAYVEGNPETRADPSGHCDWLCWTNVVSISAMVGGPLAVIGGGINLLTENSMHPNASSDAQLHAYTVGAVEGTLLAVASALTVASAGAFASAGAAAGGAAAVITAVNSAVGASAVGSFITSVVTEIFSAGQSIPLLDSWATWLDTPFAGNNFNPVTSQVESGWNSFTDWANTTSLNIAKAQYNAWCSSWFSFTCPAPQKATPPQLFASRLPPDRRANNIASVQQSAQQAAIASFGWNTPKERNYYSYNAFIIEYTLMGDNSAPILFGKNRYL